MNADLWQFRKLECQHELNRNLIEFLSFSEFSTAKFYAKNEHFKSNTSSIYYFAASSSKNLGVVTALLNFSLESC